MAAQGSLYFRQLLLHPDRDRSWRRLRSLEKTRLMCHHLKLTTIRPSPVEPSSPIAFKRNKINTYHIVNTNKYISIESTGRIW
jgi:hypothetical protein